MEPGHPPEHRRPSQVSVRLPVGVVVAFVLGAVIGAIMAVGGFSDSPRWPAPALMALDFLCPAALLPSGIFGQLFPGGFGSPHFRAIFLAYLAVTNGLLYVIPWRLTRIGLDRRNSVAVRALALVPVIVTVGLWTAGSVRRNLQVWSEIVSPVVGPTDPASRLAGRWEGVTRKGDLPVVLICRPRVGGTLDGLVYMDGGLMGRIENGTFAGDTFYYNIDSFRFRGHREADRMAIDLLLGRAWVREMELHLKGSR
jgi:hypothetical protein